MLQFSINVRVLSSLLLFVQSASGQCDKVKKDAGSDMGNWFSSDCEQNSGGQATWFVPQSDKLKRKGATWSNNSWIPPEFRYQVSPHLKTAATLRACSGSVITTYDTENANLDGRGQSVVSQRDLDHSCCDMDSKEPIRLFSGFGRSVTIIEENIFVPGGVVHITDGYFTIPSLLSSTLPEIQETSEIADALLSSLATLDHIPSITVFVPSDSAILSALHCNKTLPEEEAHTLLGSHAVKGVVAYSPLLVDGAFFRAVGGEDITISVSNGTKYVNNAKIVREDIVIKNGVVHIVDQAFFTPPADCEPRSTSSASIYLSKSKLTLIPTLSPTIVPESTLVHTPSYHLEPMSITPSHSSEPSSAPSIYPSEPVSTIPTSYSEAKYTPPTSHSEAKYTPSTSHSESKYTPPTSHSESKYTPPTSHSESTSTPPIYPSVPKSSSIPPTHISKPSTAPSPIYNPSSSTFKTIHRESTGLTTITIQTPSSLYSDSNSSTSCLTVTTSNIWSTYGSSSYSTFSSSSSRTIYSYSEESPPSIASYHSLSQKTTSSYSFSPLPPVPSSSMDSEHFYTPKYSQATTESIPCESEGPERVPSGKYNPSIWEPVPPHTQSYETNKVEETSKGHGKNTRWRL